MWRIFLIVCLVGLLPCQGAAVAATANPEKRQIALLVGNGNYAGEPLPGPVHDVQAMGRTLAAEGYDVMLLEDAGRQRMLDAIGVFRQRLAAGGVGLFYFAGHGLGVGERQLLLPIDADLRHPARLLAGGIDLSTVLAGMAVQRPGRRNLLILDACFNDPFRPGHAAALPAVPGQTLIAYAAAPGKRAAERGQHGRFTAALLRAMRAPGPDIVDALLQAQAAVARGSGGRQRPVLSSSPDWASALPARGHPAAPGALIAAAGERFAGPATRFRGILPKNSAEQYELSFWESIKDSSYPGDYEAYLEAYPNGRFAALAKARLERLRAAAAKAKEPPAAAPAARKPAEKAPPTPAPRRQAAPEPPHPAPAVTGKPAAPAPVAVHVPAGIKEFRDCPSCPVVVSLPGGSMTMGSNSGDLSERPAHRVTIGQPFAIGKYELSADEWNACVTAGGCPKIATIAGEPGNLPARDVSWDDAQRYLKWLSKLSGKVYRLPSEAEWEFAARGGTTTRYWWGEQMRPGQADCKGCGGPWGQEAPVKIGSFAANPYGLYDMNGSVWEWVGDCWHNDFRGAPSDGAAWDEKNCLVRVIRGGSWRTDSSYMPSSTRFKYDASVREAQNGFRVLRELK